MIHLQLVCAMCGKESDIRDIHPNPVAPHFGDLQAEVHDLADSAEWIFQEGICGDIYCSAECAQ